MLEPGITLNSCNQLNIKTIFCIQNKCLHFLRLLITKMDMSMMKSILLSADKIIITI